LLTGFSPAPCVKSLYLVDAACDDEDSSEDVDDLVSALPDFSIL